MRKGNSTRQENAEKKNIIRLRDAPPADARRTKVYARPAARNAHQRGQYLRGERGTHYEHGARKRDDHAHPLQRLRLFFEQKDGKQYGEEGRQLVEHGRVRYVQAVYRVEIADYPHRARQGAQYKRYPIPFCGLELRGMTEQQRERDDRRHDVAKKSLLHGRKVARQSHEQIHQRKKERRYRYEYHSLVSAFYHRTYFLISRVSI